MIRTRLPAFLILFALVPATLLAQSRRTERFQRDFEIEAGRLLRVDIDIDAAQVRLRSSGSEHTAHVTIYYNPRDFEVGADYNQRRASLDILFDRQDWIDADDDNIEAEAIIQLPPAIEMDLRARIKAGEIRIDLGGLSLTSLELTTWAGQVEVDFPEPNRTEMEFLKINTKIGETQLTRLGNARFKEADINGGIGEMRVDFRGSMRRNAEAHVDLDIGETKVSLPRNAAIKLSVSKFLFMTDVSVPYRLRKSGRYYYSRDFDQADNKFFVSVSPGMGGLRIDY